ncbi:MAG: leucine-rich repeat protein [Bacteroidales bacterium]|nr:leucine-rich repeat protein [Bacteroidales bacterium]
MEIRLKSILLILFVTFYSNIFAQERNYTSGDLSYILNDLTKTAVVVKNANTLGIVNIPTTIIYNDITYSVTSIGDNVFYGDKNISSINIPESIVSIGENAFCNCSSLSQISFPSNLKEIKKNAFNNCIELKTISLPENIEKIGEYCFANCTGLTKFTIPSKITEIEKGMFYGCKNLSEVNFHDNVTIIGESVFTKCGLTSIKLPASITTISASSFSLLSKLTSVTIPENVQSIGSQAFYGCGYLSKIIIESGNLKLSSEVFDAIDNSCKIYVPDNRLTYYSEATDWKPYKSILLSISSLSDIITISQLNYQIIDKVNKTVKLVGFASMSENVEIPETIQIENVAYTVVAIGTHAFDGNKGLISITIPATIKNIADNAFFNCSNLNSVTFLCNISAIRQQTFSGCSSLTEIILPKSLNIIEKGAFNNCISLKNIEIPSSVTSISNNLFEGCENLESISMPNTITYLGDNAFYNCQKLKTITIPSSTKTIGANSFYNCILIEKIQIPQYVESISDNAFNGCSLLNEIIVLAQNTTLGKNVFENLPEEFSITVPISRYSGYKSATNWKNYASHIKANGSQSDLYLVDGLYYEIIDNTLQTVKLVGFDTEVEDIELPEKVTINDKDYTLVYISGNTFEGTTIIKSIKVSETVSEISETAFDGMPENVVINVYETKYPYYCADPNWAKYLSQLNVIASIKEFVDNGLKYRVVGTEKKDVYIYGFDNNIPSDLTINQVVNYKEKQYSIIGIDINGLKGCTKLVSVTIPNNIVFIGDASFSGCSSLTTIKFPSNITALPDSMFCGCESLTSINIPSTISSLGDYVFANCKKLTSLELPNTITSIGKFAFLGCIKLKKVNIPNNIVEILEGTCQNCYLLDTIIFPQNLVIIGNKAFNNCKQIKAVEIPEKVTSIGNEAFSGCENLKLILVYGENTTLGSNALLNLPVPFTIYVLESLLESYKSATNWSDFAKYIKPLKYSGSSFLYNGIYYRITDFENNEVQIFGYESASSKLTIPEKVTYQDKEYTVTSICENAFENCVIPTSITLPQSIKYIGKKAFYGCTKLTTINIPENVSEILENTFSECYQLKEITIPSNVKSIGNYAFANCKMLRTARIPNSLTYISLGTFQGCHKLNSINIPEKLDSIANNAFTDCHALKELVFSDSVRIIGQYAFSNCTSLTLIHFPKKIEKLDIESFSGCLIIEKIIVESPNLALEDNVFKDCPSNMIIYVPNTNYQTYISAKDWSSYKNIIKPFYYADILTDFGCTASEQNSIILNNSITFSVESDFSIQVFVNGIDVTNQLTVEYNNYTLQLTDLESLKTIYAETTLNTKDGNVYKISKPSQLYWFLEYISKGGEYQKANAELITDIVVNDKLNQKVAVNAFEDVTQWYPINKKTNNRNSCFAGTFDGNGHVIKGLYLEDSTLNNAGLFQQLTGTIKNLALEDVYINASKNVGVICGKNNGTISNCSVDVNIFGGENVGAIAGYNENGTISNCFVKGNISGNNNVGAVCGNNSGKISECISSATINCEKTAGNICGTSSGNISNAFYLDYKSSLKAISGVNDTNNVRRISFIELCSSSLPQGFSDEIWTAGTTKSVSNLVEMYSLYLSKIGDRHQLFLSAEAKIEQFTKTYFTGRNLIKDGVLTIEYENYTKDVFNISDSLIIITSPNMYEAGKANVYGKIFDLEFIYSIYLNLDPTVGVLDIKDEYNINVWGYDKTIFIENAENFDVYISNLSGQIIKQVKIQNYLEEIKLSKGGIYIVRIKNKKYKIVI